MHTVLENVRQRQQHCCQEIVTKYLLNKFSCILQEIFIIEYTGTPYNLIITKGFLCCVKFDIYHTVLAPYIPWNLQYIYGGHFIFETGIFCFGILLPGKEYIFSMPECTSQDISNLSCHCCSQRR